VSVSGAGEAVISSATVVGGHDGRAEVLVTIAFPNGGEQAVSLPAESCLAALDAAGIARLDDLPGQPWHVVLSNLSVAFPNVIRGTAP
jgi:hypothetical protein